MSDVKMINLKIDGINVSVPEGTTILEAAATMGIKIPTLCYLKDVNAIGACRVCVVEVKGARSLVASCVYPVNEGMEVFTNTPKVRKSRKTTIELLLSNHKKECLSCSRNLNCELQRLSYEYDCDVKAYQGEMLLKSAKNLLSLGEFSIGEISDMLGFYDIYAFSHFFYKKAGCSPKKYINR